MGDEVTVAEATDAWSGPLHVVFDRIDDAPRCSALLDIWKIARGDIAVASRSALDPVVLAKAGLLPHVWIIERDGDGGFFYRLIGESVRRNFNSALRGRYLHEIYDGATAGTIAQRCVRMLANREMMFASGLVFRDGDPTYYARRILLPLCDDNGVVRFLIGALDQSDRGSDIERSGNPRFSYDFLAFVGVESV